MAGRWLCQSDGPVFVTQNGAVALEDSHETHAHAASEWLKEEYDNVADNISPEDSG